MREGNVFTLPHCLIITLSFFNNLSFKSLNFPPIFS